MCRCPTWVVGCPASCCAGLFRRLGVVVHVPCVVLRSRLMVPLVPPLLLLPLLLCQLHGHVLRHHTWRGQRTRLGRQPAAQAGCLAGAQGPPKGLYSANGMVQLQAGGHGGRRAN